MYLILCIHFLIYIFLPLQKLNKLKACHFNPVLIALLYLLKCAQSFVPHNPVKELHVYFSVHFTG